MTFDRKFTWPTICRRKWGAYGSAKVVYNNVLQYGAVIVAQLVQRFLPTPVV